jgi:hypothetical protein
MDRSTARLAGILVAVLFVTHATLARAEVPFDWSLRVQNDTRFDVDRIWTLVPDDDGVGSKVVDSGDPQYSRNETAIRFKVQATPHPRVRLEGDIELVWLNLSDRLLSLPELTARSSMDPWRIECYAAFVDIHDLLPGLDLRIGRQRLMWGSADLFNPTDNLNPDDLEDQLLFGENIANEMVRLDYTIVPEREGWLDELSFTLVWVPIFRPAQLPRSSILRIYDKDAPVPFVEDDLRESSTRRRAVVEEYMYDPTVTVELPELSLANSQVGFRALARMGSTDFTLSYYRGYEDIPWISRIATRFAEDELHILTDVTMRYPRMHVLGFDINGQLSFLRDMGFWVEGAVFFPDGLPLTFATDLPPLSTGETVGTVVDDRPFLKLTVGFDHSIGEHMFVDVQYVHGFIDELGAGNMNNYLVAGFDLKLWNERILIRLFTILQLDWIDDLFQGESSDSWEDQISVSIRPLIRINPWGSVLIDLAGIFPYGRNNSYFGEPGAGSTTIALRVSASL